ncbi:hypothetical protein [Haloferula sp. BvORR071]|uniref:hypothetical protein n=1 Tax=Haloferula sp. BvORR071 TaxID=1396141 RepID=UPI0005599AA4|nr:hypothetical protein [Haloferula sp. BvORR071]
MSAAAGKGAAASKPLPDDPAAAVAWAQAASLTDCEALLAAHKLEDLDPLLREALFLRLAELSPARLLELLLGSSPSRIASWETWMKWLALAHPELLEKKLADGALSGPLKEILIASLQTAESEKRKDPRKILEAALEKGEDRQVLSALHKLSETDPHLALDYLELLMKGGQLPVLLDGPAFLAKMAEADPARVQALIGKANSPESSMAIASVLARTLAKDDPAAAVALYDSLPASRSRSMVALELVSAWSRKDPNAALAWIEKSLPEGAVRRSALALALAPFATSDPKRVLALLGARTDGEYDQVYFNSYQTKFGGMGFGEGGVGNNNPDALRERALIALVDSDPRAAFAILDQGIAAISQDQPRSVIEMSELAAKAAGAWLKNDPAAAIAWLSSQTAETCQAILGRLSGPLHDLSPERAREGLAALDRFKDPYLARNFVRAMAPALTRADPAAAFDIAETLPQELRAAWTGAVINQMMITDPAAAAKEVGRLPEKEWPNANATIARQMADKSPQDAVAFLDNLPANAKNSTVYKDVFRSWLESQPDNAMAWWQNLPPGESKARSGSLPLVVGRLYQADPSTAPQIVGMILAVPSEQYRMEATSNLAASIAKTSPEAAYEMIANPELKLSASNLEYLKQRIESVSTKP